MRFCFRHLSFDESCGTRGLLTLLPLQAPTLGFEKRVGSKTSLRLQNQERVGRVSSDRNKPPCLVKGYNFRHDRSCRVLSLSPQFMYYTKYYWHVPRFLPTTLCSALGNHLFHCVDSGRPASPPHASLSRQCQPGSHRQPASHQHLPPPCPRDPSPHQPVRSKSQRPGASPVNLGGCRPTLQAFQSSRRDAKPNKRLGLPPLAHQDVNWHDGADAGCSSLRAGRSVRLLSLQVRQGSSALVWAKRAGRQRRFWQLQVVQLRSAKQRQ